MQDYKNFSSVKNAAKVKFSDQSFKRTKVKFFGSHKLNNVKREEIATDPLLLKYPKPLIEPLLAQKAKMNSLNYKKRIDLLMRKSKTHGNNLKDFLLSKGISVCTEDIDEMKAKHSGKRYPKRSVKRKCYKEDDPLSEDELLFCHECDQDYKGVCPKHGPMLLICDKKVPKNTPDRAIQTLPDILSIGKSSMPKAGLGVWTEVYLPEGVVFGPYKGSIIKDRKVSPKSGYAWKIRDGTKAHHYVEAFEKDLSNWLRFVNCADREERQNLLAFQFEKKIYYKTYKPILPYSELLVWYGDEYGEDLGFISKSSNKYVSNGSVRVQIHKCNICYRIFHSLESIEIHRKTHSHVKDLNLACTHCKYSTNSQISFVNHMVSHTNNSKAQVNKRSAINHVSNNSQTLPNIAKRPDISFISKIEKFDTKCDSKLYIIDYRKENPLYCSICDKTFNNFSNIANHVKIHNKPIICPYCSDTFVRHYHLEKHIAYKHKQTYPYHCPICNKGFISQELLKHHADHQHAPELLNNINSLWEEIRK